MSGPPGHVIGATGGNCYQNLVWGGAGGSGETTTWEGERERQGFLHDDTK